jgi:uncharacterized protein YgbK (DUF1537 family)
MLRCLVVADDLTGAADTGNQFAARGFVTEWASMGAELRQETQVRVINTESRYEPPEKAAERVHRAVEGNPASVVYKKIDSTLRGNLAAETDAAVAAADADLALVAPAFPANGRTIVGDFHLVDGTPVAETAEGNDPEQPVPSSRLTAAFSSSSAPVRHLPLDVVSKGPEVVRDRLDGFLDDGPTIVACDATRPRHCSALTTAAGRLDTAVLYVGSGGLAAHVPITDRRTRTLGVVGSVNETTLAQLNHVETDAVVLLDGSRAVTDPAAAVESVVPAVIEMLERTGTAVLTAARGEDDLAKTLATARSEGVEERVARDRVATALGRVVAEIASATTLTGVFVTGGSVAERVLEATESRRVRLTGQAVADGIPLGTVVGSPLDGVPIVTKAGGFGGERAIVNSLAHLERYDG